MFGIVRFVKPTRRCGILLTVLAAANFANGSAQADSFFCFTDERLAAVLPYTPEKHNGDVTLEIIAESIEIYQIKRYYGDKFMNRERVILRVIRAISGNSPGAKVTVNQIRNPCAPPLKTGDRGFMAGKLVPATDQNITFFPRLLPIIKKGDMDTHK